MNAQLRPAIPRRWQRLLTAGLACTIALGCGGEQETPHATGAADVSTAISLSLEEQDPIRRAADLSRAVDGADATDLPVIEAFLENPRIALEELDRSVLVLWWARHDPAAAFDWIQNSGSVLEGGLRSAVLRQWARTDPAAAASAARSGQTTQQESWEFQSAVAEGWLVSEQPGLEDFLRSLEPYTQQYVLGSLARRVLISGGADALMAWTEALQLGPKGRLAAFRKTSISLALVDTEAAKRWVDEHHDGPYGSNLIKLAAIGWAQHDAPGAFVWLSGLPASAERDRGVSDAFRQWVRLDPDAARDWMERADIGPWLEPAMVIHAGRVSDDDPEAGIAWANRITAPDHRDSALLRIARRWRMRDAEAALEWIGRVDVSDTLRERMRAPLNVRG